jgi:Icc-related predicted phosphoesterase
MLVLVIGRIDGRLQPLDAIVAQVQRAPLGAVFVLGNLVDGAARRAAQAATQQGGRLPVRHIEAISRADATDAQVFKQVFDRLGTLNVPIYLIPGEQDAAWNELMRAQAEYRGAARLYFVHRAAALLNNDVVVAGFGGNLTITNLPDQPLLTAPAWEAQARFDQLARTDQAFATASRCILLLTTPPRASRVDLRDGQHTGIDVVNLINRRFRPQLLCCAATEDGRGTEMIDGTLVLNPGAVAAGSYALADLESRAVQLSRLPGARSVEQAAAHEYTGA